jgi:hypothetical protein
MTEDRVSQKIPTQDLDNCPVSIRSSYTKGISSINGNLRKMLVGQAKQLEEERKSLK